ncbi:MAG: hypothetical protein ACKVIF_05300 [Rhodospirillales bacterium]
MRSFTLGLGVRGRAEVDRYEAAEALKIADHLVILKDGMIIQQGDPQRVIVEPRDPYVTDFVRDINRARVLRVRTVMEPLRDL